MGVCIYIYTHNLLLSDSFNQGYKLKRKHMNRLRTEVEASYISIVFLVLFFPVKSRERTQFLALALLIYTTFIPAFQKKVYQHSMCF